MKGYNVSTQFTPARARALLTASWTCAQGPLALLGHAWHLGEFSSCAVAAENSGCGRKHGF
jgi:hypothetical protein